MASEEHRLALPAGYRLEEFRIERMLGKGGFGITYLAEDLYLEQRVAIKEHLPDGISTRADGSTVVAQSVPLEEDYSWSLESFVKEARTLAKIQHPNVVRVSRLLEANGTAYMVMDYLEGESLDAYLARTPAGIREERLLEIVLPILDGLEAVHRTGLLHRDVKPANIYLTQEGRPLLLDFGAARQDLGRTITMTCMVSHGYSPVEQYQSKARQSAGTDIYAIGAVLYRAITGEKPEQANDRVFNDGLIPVSQRASGRYTAGFLRAIDHALAVRLEDRPDSVGAWRRELLEAGRTAQKTPSPDPKPQSEPATERPESSLPQEAVEPEKAVLVEDSSSSLKLAGGMVAVGGVGLVILIGWLVVDHDWSSSISSWKTSLRGGQGLALEKFHAWKWKFRGEDREEAIAYYNEGFTYLYGDPLDNVEKNEPEAARFFRKAAELGYAPAQDVLGQMYQTGRGVAQYYGEAINWYRKAAEQGHVAAFMHLGKMYREGVGVEQDYLKAADWYRKAAERGQAEARYYLGDMYEFGKGVEQDKIEALKWYYLAELKNASAKEGALRLEAEMSESAVIGAENRVQEYLSRTSQ